MNPRRKSVNKPVRPPAAGRDSWWPAALLFLLVAGVFLPALSHDFITYDDPVYVTKNVHVTGGLSWANMSWAFRSTEASNWHPLTWLSHMTDCQLFGLRPWGHHLTSVLLHALNTVLVFVVLRRMTGAVWRSLFVAALFGLHPLHVESVAWISERKDVLSTAFGLLTLWAYARGVQPAGTGPQRAGFFRGLALLFFALGLMAKSMLVTLPCVLLLLDYWPLNRWAGATPAARWRLVAEKLPFFALSAAASAITFLSQDHGGTVATAEDFPWPVRLANALLAYCGYLRQCFVPVRLAVFYPYFGEMPPWRQTLLAGLLLAGISATALALFRRRPYLLIGWLWFIGTLVPVIGLVQVGGQAMADRSPYLPLLGIFIMVTWAATDLTATWPHQRRWLAVVAAAVLAGCTVVTSVQLSYWKSGVSLFRHALAVTENNYVAHANLFVTLAPTAPAEADIELQAMLRIFATFAEIHNQKGIALQQTPGHAPEAIKEFQTAVRIMSDLPGPHYNLGLALTGQPGRLPEAIEEFRTAVRLKPDFADAHYNLGLALAGTPGGRTEAITEYETAVRFNPDLYLAHFNLGFLLSGFPERTSEAIAEYQAVIRLKPDLYLAHFNLGLLLAGLPGRTDEAIAAFESTLKLKPDMPEARSMLERLHAAPR